MNVGIRAEEIFAALAEDRESRWVPDALGEVDFVQTVQAVLDADVALSPHDVIRAPKPDGTWMKVRSLGAAEMAMLYLAADPVRDSIESRLLPGVCGYRRGADRALSYSAENGRFHEYSQGLAEGSSVVAFADVKQFFARTTWETVSSRIGDIAGKSASAAVERYVRDSGNRSGLPAGHADARLFGNAVLDLADRAIGQPMTRWVDDYRIFTESEQDARAALARLDAALASLGLEMNGEKVRIVQASEYGRLRGLPLESVYHPDIEDVDTVRTALRSVFLQSIHHPVDRRRLRFALPRLAEQGDDVAVDWALTTLSTMPWEAPRFCAYLSKFAGEPRVQTSVQSILLDSLDSGFEWLSIRLATLACSTGLDTATSDAVVRLMRKVESPGLWSLLLRAMSLSGQYVHVKEALLWSVMDPRAAVGSLRDLDTDDLSISGPQVSLLRECLDGGPAPIPQVQSIL